MNKKKLKIIEKYIFAKTLNLIAKNTNVSRENMENFRLVKEALTISNKLLEEAVMQVNNSKLNDISFLILKKELETANIYNNTNQNLKKIKEMITNSNY